MMLICLRSPLISAVVTSLALSMSGCSSSASGTAPGLVVLVPGAGGDGAWYRNVAPAMRKAGDQRPVESFHWGVPGPGFLLNFSNAGVHADAERKLAARLEAFRRDHPNEPIDLIAHSAGGGVALGALAKLSTDVKVRSVVLLHPSVSPTYPLAAAMAHIQTNLHLFRSDRDTTFLAWRTGTFGTYDNIKTKAAGNCGFDLSALPAEARDRVQTHDYDPADERLGDDGSHFGTLAQPFLAARVVPLMDQAAPGVGG